MTTIPLNQTRLSVEIWSDIACPWCYIGKKRFETALAQFPFREQVDVTWRAFELSPDAPSGPGRPEIDALAEMKGIPRPQVERMFAQVTAVAAGEGLSYDFDRTLSFNTFDGHRLVHLAAATGGSALCDRVLEAIYSAHFEHGEDLGDDETLVHIVTEAGLDRQAVRAVLAGNDFADAVRRDEAQARTIGVTGVPFFVVDRRLGVSGAQPAEVFTQLLDEGWKAVNPLVGLAAADPSAGACVDDSCAL
ncbi:DsbA family oxidoreductase [Cellulomonas sp. URHD0024]|uniref:DsbA family oxidoreductase n=1 Tax=Cellulomonas sp. URHD0024 TaxID=1302620 RepID=UPI00042A5A25|nr:DsbA family oxidoreductase [Cellulomonas sp. URHD0024]